MKRIIALLLICVMIPGTICSAAGEKTGTPDVVSYQFDLKLHLEADAFPFRERKLMQGYEELLDALEFRGSYAWCGETECLDLNVQVIPVSDPEASLKFRMYGWLPNWLNVSSPLLGENAVCFRPKEIMKFTARAWDFFQIPLFPLAVLFPNLTTEAFYCLKDDWVRKISKLKNKDIIPGERITRIAEYWQADMDNDEVLNNWITAATKPLGDPDLVQYELKSLPQILLKVTDADTLTIKRNGEDFRYINSRGETLYEEHHTERGFEARLTLPDTGTNYRPGFRYLQEDEEKGFSLQLRTVWDRISDDQELPETILRINADMEHIPSAYPEDAVLSGDVAVEGMLLPNIHWLVNGITGADGTVELSLTVPDRQEAGPALSCTGNVTPAVYEGTLEYMIGDIITDFNLFALSDQSLTDLLKGVLPAMMEEIPDFIYAIPTHGIQSVLDTLEQYGLLQTLLQ